MQRRCIGCGELLQNSNPEAAGFTPTLKEDVTYCKRCFRMMHYNELPKVLAKNSDYLQVVNHVLQQKGLMILVVDIFSFSISFNKEMIDKLRGNDVILVVNKFDLLPKSINVNDILNFISKECEKLFFRVIAIHIISATKGYYLDELMQTIDLVRRGRNVYILGVANVGKSSFINSIMKRFTSRTTDIIATSIIPGTTLKEIVIPFFDDNKAFIDTPGLINNKSILEHIDSNYYRMLLPKKEIKPITYQLYDSYTYFVGGLAYLSFKDAKDVSVIFYINDELKITRVKTSKLPEAIEKRLGNTIIPVANTSGYEARHFALKGRNTLFFPGYGFVLIIGTIEFDVHYSKNTEVVLYGDIIRKTNR